MEDRRDFIKGIIAATAAVGTVAAVGEAAAAEPGAAKAAALAPLVPTSPGRKLPFASAVGTPDTLSFGTDLAAIANVDPVQWAAVRTKMNEYLGPLVDSGQFLASSFQITVSGAITITGGAA